MIKILKKIHTPSHLGLIWVNIHLDTDEPNATRLKTSLPCSI